MDLGAVLREQRHAAGLSLEELAAASGVSVRGIGDLERGHSRRPQRRTLALLAGALGVPVETFRPEREPFLTDFVGRVAELTLLGELAGRADGPVAVIAGAGGVGKTSLAMRAAQTLAGGYPDGTHVVNLRGLDDTPLDGGQAVRQLLRAFGFGPREIPDDLAQRTALYRSVIGGKRALIVLDNAFDERQVRPLLHGDATSLTLVTSRSVLAGLERAHRVHLDALSPEEALELLESITGVADARVAELCGRLPLALRIVGNRLVSEPDWDVDELAARLADLSTGLEELVDLGLLQSVAGARYGFHDLMRAYARQRLTAEAAETAEMVTWLLDTATSAGNWFEPGVTGGFFAGAPAAQAWLMAEGDNWLGALRLAAAAGRHESVVRTASAMHWFCERWTYWGHWDEVFELGRDSAVALGDRAREAEMLNYLSWFAAMVRRRKDLAFGNARAALAVAEEAGDLTQQGWALRFLSDYTRMEGDLAESSANAERAWRLFEQAGDAEGASTAVGALGNVLRLLGRPAEALTRHERMLEMCDTPGLLDPAVADVLRPDALLAIGRDHLDLGHWDEATAVLGRALALARELGVRHTEAFSLETLASAEAGAGRPAEAAAHLRASLKIMLAAGKQERAADLRRRLADLGH
ncbi:tetratricopeptide repeat protein [Actinoplanes sp. CA-131856]